MKYIFYWLLKRYSHTEKQRIEILKVLDDKVSSNYSEQTMFGNVYNYFIEFVLSNSFINRCVIENDKESLKMIKSGIEKTFDETILYIIKEEENKI